MWERLKTWRNWYWGLRTYGAMSPDLRVRRRVRQQLKPRPHLSQSAWIDQCCQPERISPPIATFAYTQLQRYSGLDLGRVRLTDRLESDLQWSQICWFDWMDTLSQDFWQRFGVEITESIHESNFETVGDLLWFLNDRWMHSQVQSSSVQEV